MPHRSLPSIWLFRGFETRAEESSVKILFINNYYSPCKFGGGYRQLCEEVADGLAARGHTIAVLTSTYRHGDEYERPFPVHRSLLLDPDPHSDRTIAHQFFFGRRAREQHAVRTLEDLATSMEPDIVFVWHTMGLPRRMLQAAESLDGVITVYYMADYWSELPDEYQVYWESPPVHWTAKLLKRPLSRVALSILRQEGKPVHLEREHAICVSDYVRQRLIQNGAISPNAITVHNGVDIAKFTCSSRKVSPPQSLTCLIAGRVIPEKGIHTAIEALHLLKNERGLDGLSLAILGTGDPAYIDQLGEMVSAYDLGDTVEFMTPVPREQVPDVLASFDVLIAPAEYDEPLARMSQEAMSCGMIVVGTTTGGSGELLIDGVNGLTFSAGDPLDLAKQLKRLLDAPLDYRTQLADTGRRTILESFSITHTITGVEKHLASLITGENRDG
jgi:glycosyltransferase involved in cell wall biosynthesis